MNPMFRIKAFEISTILDQLELEDLNLDDLNHLLSN
jgi:hypothetical protein